MKTLNLRRDFFRINDAGDNEFNWVLKELGISEDRIQFIDEIEINIETPINILDELE